MSGKEFILEFELSENEAERQIDRHLVLLGLIVLLGVGPQISALLADYAFGYQLNRSSFIYGMLFGVLFVMVYSAVESRIPFGLRKKVLFGNITVTATEAGLGYSLGDDDYRLPWQVAGAPRRWRTSIVFPIYGLHLVIPNRAFESDGERDEFLAATKAWHGRATS